MNTVLGMVIDVDARRPVLGGGGGGLSGPAIHPVAVRAVYDVHAALPELPIIGAGGVTDGDDAVEMLLAGRVRGAGRHRDLRRPAALAAVRRRAGRLVPAPRRRTSRDLIGGAHG